MRKNDLVATEPLHTMNLRTGGVRMKRLLLDGRLLLGGGSSLTSTMGTSYEAFLEPFGQPSTITYTTLPFWKRHDRRTLETDTRL